MKLCFILFFLGIITNLSAQQVAAKIVNLTVERYADSISVSVNWQTNEVFSAKEFVLERSYNGRWWEEVQRIPIATNHGNKPAPYRVLDRSYRNQEAIIYYRIKTLESNGFFTCSNVFYFINRSKIEPTVIPSQWTNEPTLHFLLVGMSNQNVKIQVLNFYMQPIRTYIMTIPNVPIYEWKESQVAIFQPQYFIRIIPEQSKNVYYARWCPLPLFL